MQTDSEFRDAVALEVMRVLLTDLMSQKVTREQARQALDLAVVNAFYVADQMLIERQARTTFAPPSDTTDAASYTLGTL